MKQANNDERILFEWPKNEEEVVRATTSLYKGRRYFSVRLYYRAEGRDGWHPTKKGLTLGADHMPNLLKAVKALVEAAKGEGGDGRS